MWLQTGRDVGLILRDLRTAKNWTQAEFAERLGKTRRWVMMVELGQTNADISTIIRAFRLLGAQLRLERIAEQTSDPNIDRVLSRGIPEDLP